MFVINCVELNLFHQLNKVWKLHGDDAVGLEGDFHPGHEVVQVGNMGQHVVADDQICLFSLGDQVPCRAGAEEAGQ